MVAGRGFEPPDLRVMSPTSYQAAPPRDVPLSFDSLLIIYNYYVIVNRIIPINNKK